MSLVLKRSLWSNWDALGRIEGSVLVSRVIYLAKSGQFLDSMLGILPCPSSPSVCTRSISVPNGWNNSNAITPILYRSDCTNETNTEHMCLRCNSHKQKYSPKNSKLYIITVCNIAVSLPLNHSENPQVVLGQRKQTFQLHLCELNLV